MLVSIFPETRPGLLDRKNINQETVCICARGRLFATSTDISMCRHVNGLWGTGKMFYCILLNVSSPFTINKGIKMMFE